LGHGVDDIVAARRKNADAYRTALDHRAVFAELGVAGGVIVRTELDSALGHLDKDQRHMLRRAGIDIGVLDIYHPGLLKPGAARWRAALLAARAVPEQPPRDWLPGAS
jgi:hypothetical protein